MLKKLIAIILSIITVSTLLVGCSITQTKDGLKVMRLKWEKNFGDVGCGLSNKGKGVFYITTANGTSQNQNIPPIYLYSKNIIMQIIYDVKDFQNGKTIYFYIDGKLRDTQVFENDYEGTLTLRGDTVRKGTHKVEAIQYDGNTASTDVNNIKVYKYAQYKVSNDEHNILKQYNKSINTTNEDKIKLIKERSKLAQNKNSTDKNKSNISYNSNKSKKKTTNYNSNKNYTSRKTTNYNKNYTKKKTTSYSSNKNYTKKKTSSYNYSNNYSKRKTTKYFNYKNKSNNYSKKHWKNRNSNKNNYTNDNNNKTNEDNNTRENNDSEQTNNNTNNQQSESENINEQ